MKQFFATSAACAFIFLGVVMLIGPLAPVNTLAFKLAMRIYTGM